MIRTCMCIVARCHFVDLTTHTNTAPYLEIFIYYVCV